MSSYRNILAAIDDFQASERLLRFVAELAAGNENFRIHLFHALGPLPPELLESPGAEDPVTEEVIENRQETKQNLWLNRARNEARTLFEQAKAVLTGANVPENSIRTHLPLLTHKEDLVREMIETARANHCCTVLVGRSSYPWVRELLHTHLSEQLLLHSNELAICVVNEQAAADPVPAAAQ